MITEEQQNILIEKATKARENAFVPKSDHKVGACVLTTDGEYFAGCNVEGIVSGLGTCAERCAIDTAVAQGKYVFAAMCVVDDYINISCGACLQYILQFFQIEEKEMTIIAADTKGNKEIYSLFDLLPHGYRTQHNLEKIKMYHNK